jgi:hypothetical protein
MARKHPLGEIIPLPLVRNNREAPEERVAISLKSDSHLGIGADDVEWERGSVA